MPCCHCCDTTTNFIIVLKISGFKCHKGEKLFNFSDINLIVGGNHTGKTTIADAIAFGVTGQGFWGGHVIDQYYNEETPNITVTMEFYDENAQKHLLVRKRKNDRMDIALDNRTLRQADLHYLFGERDEFLSLLNPLYFIEELGDAGSSLLEKHLRMVPHEAVLQKLDACYLELLKNIDFVSSDILLKNLRLEKKELEASIAGINGQLNLLQFQGNTKELQVSELSKAISQVKAAINELTLKKLDGQNASDLSEQLACLTLQYEEMLKAPPQPMSAEDYTKSLRTISDKLYSANTQQYKSKYADKLSEMQAQLYQARMKHSQLSRVKTQLAPNTNCPQCLRKITKDDMSNIKGNVDKLLLPIVTNGSVLKAQFEDLKKLDAKSRDKFEQFKKDDITRLELERTQLESSWQEQQKGSVKAQSDYALSLQTVNKQIQTLDEQLLNGALSIEESIALQELCNKLIGLESVHEQMTAKIESGDYKLDEQIKLLQEQINEKTAVISAVIEYEAKKAELLFDSLSTKNVKCQLYEIVKTTGELKKTFRFTYKGRDYRRLSRSERLLAGMEMAQLLRKLTNRHYPVFVDDSESIENIPQPDCQVFLARVMRNAQLSVKSTARKPTTLSKAG